MNQTITTRNTQLIQTVRARMNATRTALIVRKETARLAHHAKNYSIWSKHMNRCKVLKRKLHILAEYLHILLFAAGITKVYRKPTSNAMAKEIFEAVYPGKVHFLHQAQ